MNVTFYSNFSKRKNSTKRPTGGVTLDCKMKQDCSLSQPVLLIDGIDLSYNYCYFNGRYYFINDIVLSKNDIYEIRCQVDVLATYKTQIGNYNTFVERSSSNYDININDALVSSSNDIVSDIVRSIDMPADDGTDGYYICPVTCSSGYNVYVFENLNELLYFYNFGTTINLAGVTQTTDDNFLDAVEAAGMAFMSSDIQNYMTKIYFTKFYPKGVPSWYDVSNKIGYGPITYTMPGAYSVKIMKPAYYTWSLTRPLTFDTIYTDFRKSNRQFSQYYVFLPGCGQFELDPLDVAEEDLTVRVDMDYLSGMIRYTIRHSTGAIIGIYDGKFGNDIPATAARTDVISLAHSALGFAGSAASFDFFKATDQAMSVAEKAFLPQVVSQSSSIDNMSAYNAYYNILAQTKCWQSKDIPVSVAGRPYYTYAAINTLSGYVKCGMASLDIPGFAGEKEEVNGYLNGGFYYE